MPVIEFRSVSKRQIEEELLDRLSFSVDKGEWNLSLAEDPTTRDLILRMIAGLVRSDDGKILIGTRDAWTTERITGRTIGFITPWQSFPADLTLIDLIRQYVQIRHLDRTHPLDEDLLREELKFFSLENNPTIGSLSQDEAMAFQCVVAHQHQPTIYIAQDLSKLFNETMRQRILTFLEARRDEGQTILLIDQQYHPQFPDPDRIQILYQGRLKLNLSSQAIASSPVEKGLILDEACPPSFYEACVAYQERVNRSALQDHLFYENDSSSEPPPVELPEPKDTKDRQQKLSWPGGGPKK